MYLHDTQSLHAIHAPSATWAKSVHASKTHRTCSNHGNFTINVFIISVHCRHLKHIVSFAFFLEWSFDRWFANEVQDACKKAEQEGSQTKNMHKGNGYVETTRDRVDWLNRTASIVYCSMLFCIPTCISYSAVSGKKGNDSRYCQPVANRVGWHLSKKKSSHLVRGDWSVGQRKLGQACAAHKSRTRLVTTSSAASIRRSSNSFGKVGLSRTL